MSYLTALLVIGIALLKAIDESRSTKNIDRRVDPKPWFKFKLLLVWGAFGSVCILAVITLLQDQESDIREAAKIDRLDAGLQRLDDLRVRTESGFYEGQQSQARLADTSRSILNHTIDINRVQSRNLQLTTKALKKTEQLTKSMIGSKNIKIFIEALDTDVLYPGNKSHLPQQGLRVHLHNVDSIGAFDAKIYVSIDSSLSHLVTRGTPLSSKYQRLGIYKEQIPFISADAEELRFIKPGSCISPPVIYV